MESGKLVFAQLMDFVPRHDFDACVRRYGGDRRPRGFSCRDQFLCLAFAQLTFRESLRDIETCLRAVGPKLYHAGFRGKIARARWPMPTTLTTAHLRRLCSSADRSSAEALCRGTLRCGPGADRLRPRQYNDRPLLEPVPLGAVPPTQGGREAAHALGPARQHPLFRADFHGKTHDVTVLDHLPIEPGSFYVMDRGYVDFRRLHRFTTCSAFFVTRAKRGLDFTRRARRPVDKATGLRSDQTIVLAGRESSRLYPDPLRRIAFYDAERPAVCLPDQQLHPARADNRAALQVQVAN